jgi:hypothetical protein
VSSVQLAGNADIAHNTANPSTWNKYAGTFPPYLIEFVEKLLIPYYLAELSIPRLILFECPIGG